MALEPKTIRELLSSVPLFSGFDAASLDHLLKRSQVMEPAKGKILFMQGGGLSQNALIPLNLVGHKPLPATIDFIHTGSWSGKSIKEAGKYASVNIAATGKTGVPPVAEWKRSIFATRKFATIQASSTSSRTGRSRR